MNQLWFITLLNVEFNNFSKETKQFWFVPMLNAKVTDDFSRDSNQFLVYVYAER